MLRLLAFTVLACFALPSTVPAQTQDLGATRLAFFSPSRAFAASPDGKIAQMKLEALQVERTKEIETRNQQLQNLRATLEQGAAILSDAARRIREQEIAKFQVDLERFIQDAQGEFAGIQRDLETTFLAKLRPALDVVARERALDLVLNEDAGLIAWSHPSLDITSDVVAQLGQP